MIRRLKQVWGWIKRTAKRGWAWLAVAVLGVTAVMVGDVPPSRQNLADAVGCNNSDGAHYFAEIDKDDTVLRVIVVEEEVINSGLFGDPSNWVETCYDDDSKRRNYAGSGYRYDKGRNGFVSKKPDERATLDEDTLRWITPE